jgi:hypothetical protein
VAQTQEDKKCVSPHNSPPLSRPKYILILQMTQQLLNESEIKLAESVESVRRRISIVPSVALVLGSGLGDLADQVEDAVRIPYAEIPHFKTSSVQGHQNCLVIGRLNGTRVDNVVCCLLSVTQHQHQQNAQYVDADLI